MPETSHMGEEMRRAGAESKRQFEQGFNSGTSPESMGQSFGSKLTASLGKEFAHFELPFGANAWIDRMSGDIDQKVISKLRGEATKALQDYRTEYDNLTQAQGRATEAESKLSIAREGGFNKASIMLPLMQENTRAQNELNTAQTNASTALGIYNQKTGELRDVTKEAAGSSQILAGLMGGLMVVGAQAATGAIEGLVEGIAEGFKMAIELTKEVAEKTVELGETYEHIGIQIHEFSRASGEEFESLEHTAQQVFSTLDVAGNDTGKTMAQLASMLNTSGQSISSLVGHVVELQGRFTNLRSSDLGSIFVAFKTPVEQTDSALASLLQSAQGAGQGLGDLASQLSGNVAITLHEAGLSLQQAGAFTADLMKMGDPGRQAMSGLATAMKDFGNEGLTFADGMKLAGQRLQELGDTAEGQGLAEKLFGTRNWIVAKNAVQDYLDIMNQGPDAFNANATSTDEFLHSTENLENHLETFKHKVEEAFKPFGDAAKGVALNGLNSISVWFTTHRTEIIGDIKHFGDEFIDALPKIKEFAADGLRLAGDFASGLMFVFAPVAETLAAAGAGMLALSGHFGDAKDLLVSVSKIDTQKIGQMANDFADKIDNWKIDSESIKESWDGIADAAMRVPPGIGASGIGGPNPFASTAPGAFPSPVTGAPGTPGAPSAPGGPLGAFAPTAGATGVHVANWDAIAQKESTGVWNQILTTGVTDGGGLQIKPGTWADFGGLVIAPKPYMASKADQIMIAERILNGWNGKPGQGPAAWQNGENYVGYQGGGYIGTSPFDDPTEPIDSKWLALWWAHQQDHTSTAIPITGRANGGPGPTDTVPAMLTPGEYVWDTKTVDKYGWLIKSLHEGTMGFQGGGDVPGLNTGGAQVDTIAVAEAAQQLFGVNDIGMYNSPDGFNEHSSGEAADVMVGNNKSLGDQVAQYFLQNAGQFGVQYVLWQQKQWNPDGSTTPMGDRGSPTKNHMDHVHVRTLGGGYPPGGGPGAAGAGTPPSGASSGTPSSMAVQALGGAGSTPGGKGGASFPGMSNQYGGLGVYGGETADQQASAAKAVREANERKAQLDWEVSQQQKKVDDLQAKLNAPPDPAELGLLTGQPLTDPTTQKKIADKRKQTQDELDVATHDLATKRQEAADAVTDAAEADRKQTEAMYKKPAGTGKTQKATGSEEFAQLGSSLLGGIGQELGFGDLFAKPPWEWGAVKLLTGAASWAMGTANAWAEQIGQGKTGIGGPGWGNNSGVAMPGWDQQGSQGGDLFGGLLGSLGVNLPHASVTEGLSVPSVSTGPNVVPGSLPVASGQGTGPAPGPMIAGDYMPINVQAGVDPRQVLAPVQEQRNSQNAQLHGQTGGLPR